ncbi:hypothetical protein IQ06DRAFT_3433 [Phaeosphaeriaceae sp. SRC1lsM3a]|nr:hypothetical protein IQ06DRAFT_3433 [Stagonospora sp. SRC1lsM3a]
MAYATMPKAFQGDQARQPFVQPITRRSNEQPKRAINAYLDWQELGIHLLGLSATAVVIGLHAANHYWVDLGDDGELSINATLNYLQFAAKLHETAMMASMSCVLLFLLHRRLIQKGVSFGHLDAPYMIGAGGGVGLLVTKRFWSPWRQHYWFLLMLFLSILFTLALNPASAIAMIPSLAYWPMANPYGLAKGSVFRVYYSLPFILPEVDGRSEVRRHVSMRVPRKKWIVLPRRLLVSQPLEAGHSGRGRNVSRRVTTTPTFLSTTAIGGFWAYVQKLKAGKLNSGVRWPLLKSKEGSSIYQPILYSQCQSDLYNVNNTGTMHNITFDTLQAPWGDNKNTSNLFLSPETKILQKMPVREPQFGWFFDEKLSIMSLSILPVEASNATVQSFQSSLVVTCMFDARWAASKIKLNPRSSSLIESNLTDFSIFEENQIGQYGSKDQLKRALNISELVQLPLNWLKGFNFNVTEDGKNLTAITAIFDDLLENTTDGNRHFQMTTLDTPKTIGTPEFADYQRSVTDFVGTYQSMLLADGMARFASWLWQPYLEIPSSDAEQVFRNGTKNDAFSVEFETWRYGYGYGFRSDDTGTSIYIAITILGIYALITIIYVVVIFWYRCKARYTRSQAWEAMINLIALAKNSEPSPYLVGTGAGIDERDTWRLKVKVREMDDERLDLAFMKDYEEVGTEPGIMKKYH